MNKKVIATNFGPNNGSGYYETNHYDDVIEITYVSEIDVVLWPGEYANLEHYLESPECDEYNTHDVHEQLGDIAHRLSSAHQEELQKCKDSPVYFYNKYVRRKGQKELTKVEFEDFVKQVEYQRNRPSKIPSHFKNRPPTFDQCNDFHNAYLMGREEGQKIAELYQPVNGYHPVTYLHLDDIKGLGYDGSELDENDLRSLAINLGEKLNYDYGEFLRELCRDELKLKKL